jgi:hypothetical protein
MPLQKERFRQRRSERILARSTGGKGKLTAADGVRPPCFTCANSVGRSRAYACWSQRPSGGVVVDPRSLGVAAAACLVVSAACPAGSRTGRGGGGQLGEVPRAKPPLRRSGHGWSSRTKLPSR